MAASLYRRRFLKISGSAATACFVTACFGEAAKPLRAQTLPPPMEFVLRGGRSFVDGKWGCYDIGVTAKGALVVSPTPIAASGAYRVIDVSGKVVSPGFIDILADNSANPKNTFRVFEKYKLGDGVTTALQMHGGAEDAGDFYKYFAGKKHHVNYGVSTKVMYIRLRHSSMANRVKAIEQSLDGGAMGVSHSPEYQPSTKWDELLEYARLAKKYDRPLFLHARYSSSEKELSGVWEAIRLARETGCRVHIDHLNSTGGTFHMEEALNLIRDARAAGLEVTTCVYPSSYWATYLSSERFSGDWQSRYGMTWSDLEVVGTGERLTEESFKRYRQKTGLLVAARDGVQPMEKTVKPALLEDFCVIGSDGGIESEPNANNHPRGANCFSTAVRYALDENIPLERILDKMTSRSAQLIGPPMKGRGELRDGYVADITVFDPARIRGVATNNNPCRFSEGIELVVVGGKIAFEQGAPTGADNGTAISY